MQVSDMYMSKCLMGVTRAYIYLQQAMAYLDYHTYYTQVMCLNHVMPI